jgi:two-component system cell cycle sensor histidine kinase/response regulator CckA
LRPVRVDPSHFQQLVLNLAANARDAMPKGGLLTIATANVNVPCDHLPVVGIPRGEYVLLTIADTGTGMSDEVKARLFEPFFTTKEKGKGTGLGLALAYGVVQQSAGFIRVDSELGRGTTFRIFLPTVHGVELQSPPKSRRTLPGGAETILLVQDGQAWDSVADQTLRDLGYAVWSADSPLRALEICRSSATRIQLMVSPTVPHGMRADVLVSTIKEIQPDIKALLVSSGKELPAAETNSGAAPDVLPWRFSRRALAIKVREVLDRT